MLCICHNHSRDKVKVIPHRDNATTLAKIQRKFYHFLQNFWKILSK